MQLCVALLVGLVAVGQPKKDGDNDADGIRNSLDRCPNDPEDKDGFEDEDGCPDPDNDRDGIADVNDKCPNAPETINGFKDDDGCADEEVKKLMTFDKPVEKPAVVEQGRATADELQKKWVLAVMDIEARVPGMKADMKRSLTDQLRIFLGQRKMKVVDRGAQEAALKSLVDEEKKKSYASCVDASCQVPLGKALAATHLLRSSFQSFDPSTCTANGELIDLKTEVTVAAVSVRSACKPADLLQASERLADQLIRESVVR